MSREIHDTLLQDLGAIGLELDVLAARLEPAQHTVRDSLQDLRRQVSRCLRSARQSIWELRSPRRDDNGLVTGFEGLARDDLCTVVHDQFVTGSSWVDVPRPYPLSRNDNVTSG
jgi:signal transduction histidine kinase